MALSFLSGDAGTPSLKEVEARAYAIEAAKKIKLARMLKQESDASMNSMFIGLDEITGPMQRVSRTDTRQPKPQRGSRPNERSAPQPTPMNATPAPPPPPAPTPGGTRLMPQLPGGGRARVVDSLPGGGSPITTAPRDVTKTLVSAEVRDKKIAEREIEGLLKKAESDIEKAEEAVKEEAESPMSFLKGKNALIIGGVAVAVIAAFYFLKKK
jgi:hypothetical protein